MKKILLYLFFSFLYFTISFAGEGLKGVYNFELVIENPGGELCKVTEQDIEREVKYVLSNTPINLKKDIFGNKNNDPRFKGLSSSSKDGVTIINKGIFTSCKKNDSCPPWTIQADKITYDKNKKQMSYDNALVKIYDVPVLYFPKFFHPGPTVKRQSGFLVPHINNSNILGTSLQVPYFYALSINKDFTFKPTLFDKNVFMFQNE